MEISKKVVEEKPKNLWKTDYDYQVKAVYIINNYNIIELNNNFQSFILKVPCYYFFCWFNYQVRRVRFQNSFYGRFRKKKGSVWNMWRM